VHHSGQNGIRDRDSRVQAETYLRKLCKVSCSVPYPKKVRILLDDLVKKGKALHPNKFIRTRVNVDNLFAEAHVKTEEGWLDLNLKTPIPLDVLDRMSVTNTEIMAVDDNTPLS
jgi:hypothetical protein